ncbi:hypothetical protein [Micromonospora sp. WMMD1155]|uniref:hypothetical protein n=1 Tax=Micromonospora sp. WMMD1155 TaxID=3016094 RepID=UPI00249C2616|nr:hypothetical protein [Micromonospora sp. WMMD1155]WFE53349.1 hypothetical protein O7617_24850 [Micromonospora sp. WMMD1155]
MGVEHVPPHRAHVRGHGELTVEQFRRRMGDRSPIWTMIGVAARAAPKMRVEIRVTAVVGRS